MKTIRYFFSFAIFSTGLFASQVIPAQADFVGAIKEGVSEVVGTTDDPLIKTEYDNEGDGGLWDYFQCAAVSAACHVGSAVGELSDAFSRGKDEAENDEDKKSDRK